MKLKKVNRERRQTIYFTDSKGIRRPVVFWFDDLSNAKKPPAWMQAIMYDDDTKSDPIDKGA